MFPITMTFTVSTHAELAALVAAIPIPAGTDPVTKAVFTADAPKGDKKPGPKPEKPAVASAAPPADTPATPAPTGADSGADKALDYDADIKPLFLKLVQTKGRDAGRKVIDAFAPTKAKLSEAIKPEQYADALAMIKRELGE